MLAARASLKIEEVVHRTHAAGLSAGDDAPQGIAEYIMSRREGIGLYSLKRIALRRRVSQETALEYMSFQSSVVTLQA
jgi:hypothetical protein